MVKTYLLYKENTSSNYIAEKLAKKELDLINPKTTSSNRPPVMCPGCPHRGVYYILNKLKKHATGDIGCYTLGALTTTRRY